MYPPHGPISMLHAPIPVPMPPPVHAVAVMWLGGCTKIYGTEKCPSLSRPLPDSIPIFDPAMYVTHSAPVVAIVGRPVCQVACQLVKWRMVRFLSVLVGRRDKVGTQIEHRQRGLLPSHLRRTYVRSVVPGIDSGLDRNTPRSYTPPLPYCFGGDLHIQVQYLHRVANHIEIGYLWEEDCGFRRHGTCVKEVVCVKVHGNRR